MGLPTWAWNGLSVGGLVTFILMGLATSRLWTKRQVDIVREDHNKAILTLERQHDREVADLKARYEKHGDTTVKQFEERVAESVKRESDWRDVAFRWQAVSEMLAGGLEPMQEQSASSLAILQSWQAAAAAQRPGKRT
jgi:hypothetical protein